MSSGIGGQDKHVPDDQWPTSGPSPLISTTGVPTARQYRQSRRAEQIARRAVKRIISDNSPATQPIPIVERLRGTPYSKPYEMSAPPDAEARRILDFALSVGETMLRSGAGTADVEVSVIAVAAACGLKDVDVDLTYQTVMVHYTTFDGRPLTVLGVNRSESISFARLSAVHQLVSDLANGRLEREDAIARMDAIKTQPKPFNRWLVSLSWAVLSGALVVLLGGGWLGALVGTFMTFSMDRLGRRLARTGMPYMFNVLIVALLTTTVAMLLARVGLPIGPQYVIAAGLVPLLPTMSLFSAAQDAITNFPLTAAGRMINVLMAMAAIVSGIGMGTLIGRSVGLNEIDVLVSGLSPLAASILGVLMAFIVAGTGSIAHQSRRRLVLPSAAVGSVGFIVMLVMQQFGFGPILVPAVAAAVVSILASVIALRLGAPPVTVIIPGIFPLLPGLSIFGAAYQLVQPEEAVSLATSLSSLFAALGATAALAVGAVFGNFIASPLRTRRKTPGNGGNPLVG
ncbi:threonine/serine exporter family protein [Saxibacter everestensis]|uniref:Threonine/serine exporter family protein n=1 Tax=Saxibacter everestensis TaxID=2909229 RepID=A0ABY8QW05_9MICO|nr:threonine/serine exporter family protein [Brevibacteriaceae bacterium ZFBP1038]